MIAAIYARLNTKAVDRALQTQADRFCTLVQGPAVLPAMTAQTKERNRRRRDDLSPPLEGLALLVRLKEYDHILAYTLWRPDHDAQRVGE